MRHLALAAALATVGCAHAPRWTELTSPHFVLRTDLPPSSARRALARFEVTYAALETLAFANHPPRERIDFILFRSEEDFRALAPRGATGYFMPHQLDEPAPLPTIAMYGDDSDASQRRFTHELTHRFMDHQLGAAPPWLEEGLAEYYSTMQPASGDVRLGGLPNASLFRLDVMTSMGLSDRHVDTRVELSAVPSVAELLAADHERFHAAAHELAYYFASWTLVHMLLHGKHGYRPRFSRYLSSLTAGVAADEAWRQAFGDVDVARLDGELRAYLIKLYLDEKSLRVRLPDVGGVERERRMRDFEVPLLRARIRPWDCRENILAAGRELQSARALAGREASAELHYWSALYAERWRHFGEAEAELGQAVALDLAGERYWLALAELLARPDRDDKLDEARLDDAMAHLQPLARRAESLQLLAHYFADQGDAARGLPLAVRAAELEPDCRACVETLSTLRNLSAPSPPGARAIYTRPSIE